MTNESNDEKNGTGEADVAQPASTPNKKLRLDRTVIRTLRASTALRAGQRPSELPSGR